MNKNCLAVDIGASSGRLILGTLEGKQLKLEEIHRFENKLVQKNGHVCWDVTKLFGEIKKGIQKCKDINVLPTSIGIDTWAVDFLLLDEQDQPLTEAIAYRDQRTDGMMDEVFEQISKEKLYSETGIQFQKFNTIYQLYSLKKTNPEVLEKAKTFLMIPDYFNFLLTGKKANEYTNATTTQLVNTHSKEWDSDILGQLGIPKRIFQDIKMPKTILGNLSEELVKEVGFDMKVVLPATHDTGSAVISVPELEDTIYLSSGTWSLIGVENPNPVCDMSALDYNFTNEGGIDYRYRFLKNIMGLWMIQEVKRNYEDKYSFAQLVEMAREAVDFTSIVNVDDERFLKPDNMIKAIQEYCEENHLAIPTTPGEVAKCVYESLAMSYEEAIQRIEEIYEKKYDKVNVIGGGCQNELLNQLIADKTGKEVYAGPVEATAIGNIVAQFMATGEIENIEEARTIIQNSFEIKKYTSNCEGMTR